MVGNILWWVKTGCICSVLSPPISHPECPGSGGWGGVGGEERFFLCFKGLKTKHNTETITQIECEGNMKNKLF